MAFCNEILSLFLVLVLICLTEGKFDYYYVTCGSTLKLLNPYHNVRLHSHDVKYGSGSGQQSVTAVESSDDHNSYWQVKGKLGEPCERGQPVKCGQTVRLLHLNTNRNLHSHHFQSPLSHNLEVTAFGENGEGDEGDHWTVVCSGSYWDRQQKVRIKNVVTENYLHITGDTFGRPIYGQKEVSCYPSPNELNYWQAAEGIFIKPSDQQPAEKVEKDELYLHVTGDTYGRPIHGQKEVCGYASPNELNYWQAAEGIFIKPSEPPVPSAGPKVPHDEF